MASDLLTAGATPDQAIGPELLQAMLFEDPAFFANEILTGPQGAPFYGRFLISKHHEEWADVINRHKLICVEAARGCGKSWFFALAYPIWKAWREPGCGGYIFSETQPQANKRLRAIKEEIEKNPRLRHLKGTRWTETEIAFSNGSTIVAAGFGVKIRGGHPNWIVGDDVVSDTAAYSELLRERHNNFFFSAVRGMLEPNGQLILDGTPQHNGDLYGIIEQNKAYAFRRYPAITANKALWPERFDKAALDAIREEIGELRFTREFLCKPVGAGSTLFPPYLFEGEPFNQFNARLGPRLSDGTPAHSWWRAHGVNRFYAGVDIAVSSNIRADWFCMFVVGLDNASNRWIVDIMRDQGLPYDVQRARVNDRCRLWHIELVTFEGNAAQRIYGDEFIRQTDIPVNLHFTGNEKHHLEKGIPGIRTLLETHKYRCPRGEDPDDHTIILTDQWIGELQSYTVDHTGKVVSVGEHDDVAMAGYLCEKGIQKGESFDFAFDTQDGDDEAALEQAGEIDQIAPSDDWVSMGLDEADLHTQGLNNGARGTGHRSNLDFAGTSRSDPFVIGNKEAAPPHPLGAGIPLGVLLPLKRNH